MQNALETVILAAGKGTRMRSDIPKVLHPIAGKALVQHVLDRAEELGAAKQHVVVGHEAEQVIAELVGEGVSFVEQKNQLGTGHAVKQCLPELKDDSIALILYGDVPLTKTSTLKTLVSLVGEQTMALLTVNLDQPKGYGRIVRNAENQVVAIVEEKDATEQQKTISEVNTGIMAVNSADLKRWIPQIDNDNAQKEYYLTDIISIAHAEGKEILTAQPQDSFETLGVNNRLQQAELERIYQREQANIFMEQGLTLLDPQRFDCRGTLKAGKDCVVDVNCIFEGNVVLGEGVYIGPNCHIKNAEIADNVEIKSHTVIEDAKVGINAVVGPFARLRPQTEISKNAKVGNFVEIKKALIGENSKVNHLSYVGDALVGDNVNIGAGTITCNYDGVNKFKTTIGDGVFVGSNTALVAPVALGSNVTVAAGSVITSDVQEQALAVARSRQRNIDAWVRPTKLEKP